MRQLLIGSLLATFAMFFWGFLFWAMPVSSGTFQQVSNYEEIGAELREVLPGDGIYQTPW